MWKLILAAKKSVTWFLKTSFHFSYCSLQFNGQGKKSIIFKSISEHSAPVLDVSSSLAIVPCVQWTVEFDVCFHLANLIQNLSWFLLLNTIWAHLTRSMIVHRLWIVQSFVSFLRLLHSSLLLPSPHDWLYISIVVLCSLGAGLWLYLSEPVLLCKFSCIFHLWPYDDFCNTIQYDHE